MIFTSMVAQSGHLRSLPSHFHFYRASTSIELPLPRTSTSTPLVFMRMRGLCSAHVSVGCEKLTRFQRGSRSSLKWKIGICLKRIKPRGDLAAPCKIERPTSNAQRGIQHLVCVTVCLFVFLRLFSYYRLRGVL